MRIWKRNWMVYYAVCLHGGWGLVLFWSDAPLNTTAMGHVPLENRYVAAAFFLAIALLAIFGTLRRLEYTFLGFLLTLPQQFALMLSAFSAGWCVLRGQYVDGYTPQDPWFIFCDQLPALLAMVLHTCAMLDWFLFCYSPQEP